MPADPDNPYVRPYGCGVLSCKAQWEHFLSLSIDPSVLTQLSEHDVAAMSQLAIYSTAEGLLKHIRGHHPEHWAMYRKHRSRGGFASVVTRLETDDTADEEERQRLEDLRVLFSCTVPGCHKAWNSSNGLQYHIQVSGNKPGGHWVDSVSQYQHLTDHSQMGGMHDGQMEGHYDPMLSHAGGDGHYDAQQQQQHGGYGAYNPDYNGGLEAASQAPQGDATLAASALLPSLALFQNALNQSALMSEQPPPIVFPVEGASGEGDEGGAESGDAQEGSPNQAEEQQQEQQQQSEAQAQDASAMQVEHSDDQQQQQEQQQPEVLEEDLNQQATDAVMQDWAAAVYEAGQVVAQEAEAEARQRQQQLTAPPAVHAMSTALATQAQRQAEADAKLPWVCPFADGVAPDEDAPQTGIPFCKKRFRQRGGLAYHLAHDHQIISTAAAYKTKDLEVPISTAGYDLLREIFLHDLPLERRVAKELVSMHKKLQSKLGIQSQPEQPQGAAQQLQQGQENTPLQAGQTNEQAAASG